MSPGDYGEAYETRHSEAAPRGWSPSPQGPIWTALGISRQDWQQALQNAEFFSKSHLAALDEIGARQLDAGLRKTWGADYARNVREASRFLEHSGKQFFVARDDEGHAFRYMPLYWEAALAASQQSRPIGSPVQRFIYSGDAI